ncbi:MAG: transposase [Gemmatimonadaceae bacterium]
MGGPLRVPEDDRAFATRLARSCARHPVALERLTSDRTARAVTYRSDKSDGPTAGTETVDPLEFLAQVLVHMPDKGHVTTRYDGWYATRPRGTRGKAATATADAPAAIVAAARLAPPEASRRWAKARRRPCGSRSSRSTRSRVPAATAPCATSPASPSRR